MMSTDLAADPGPSESRQPASRGPAATWASAVTLSIARGRRDVAAAAAVGAVARTEMGWGRCDAPLILRRADGRGDQTGCVTQGLRREREGDKATCSAGASRQVGIP
eukprot:scaffold1945_cov395-Prasinococcus_capsulatus_cf.AAC.12